MKKKIAQPVSERDYKSALKKHAKALTELDTLNAEKKQEQQDVDQRYAKGIEKQEQVLKDTFPTIQQYCEVNRDELFTDAKSIDTGLGVTVGFRTGAPKLEYGDGVKADDLLKALKRKGLSQYIKTKESVDAQAIIKSNEDKKLGNALEGVSCAVTQTEAFFVKAN